MTETRKTVLLGVTGCIGAYKACEILRALQKRDVEVKVVMTESAAQFVGVETFRALTGDAVLTRFFEECADPIPHISLAKACDLFLIAPCTANVLAKIACGIADDLLTTTALAAVSPVVIAPAMNVHMYENAITQENIARLKARGIAFIEPGDGYLACGDIGRGRLAEPDDIADRIVDMLGMAPVERDLAGKHVLITAGPTREPIDPVRYISNRSSGKMGYAIAEAAAQRGARVTVVSGPVALGASDGIDVVEVETACEMLAAADEVFADADIAIFTAAVADYRMAEVSDHKIKKDPAHPERSFGALVENPDILATLAARRRNGQVVIGFAAETDDVEENAQKKLNAKGADMIVANKVGHDLTFGKDDVEASFVTEEAIVEQPLMPKAALAHKILDFALKS